jgi:hypothetical protein
MTSIIYFQRLLIIFMYSFIRKRLFYPTTLLNSSVGRSGDRRSSCGGLKAKETKKCRHRDDDDDLVEFCQLWRMRTLLCYGLLASWFGCAGSWGRLGRYINCPHSLIATLRYATQFHGKIWPKKIWLKKIWIKFFREIFLNFFFGYWCSVANLGYAWGV